MNLDFRNWLNSIRGQKLVQIRGLIYAHDEKENLFAPDELELRFESSMTGKLSCCSDGASLCWEQGELIENDMGEYGKQIIKNLSSFPDWRKYIGKNLLEIKLVEPVRDPCLMGLQLEFEDDLFLVIVNLGDELFIYEELPEEIIQDEEVKFSSINA